MIHLSQSDSLSVASTGNSQHEIYGRLSEPLLLSANGNMSFHWTDFDETCEWMKRSLLQDPQLAQDYARKEEMLHKLCLIPIWIRTNKSVHQTTMFDLYEKYLLNLVTPNLGIDPFGPVDISFISSTGPFRSMALTECFNETTYKDFVMVYLIKDKLPRRDFRVRLNSRILMEYGQDYQNSLVVSLEQIGIRGLLLAVDAPTFINKISKFNNFKLFLDFSTMKMVTGKSLSELRTDLSQFAFNLFYSSHRQDALTINLKHFVIQSSFDFVRSQKVYLFVPYSDFSDNTNSETLNHFIQHVRLLVKESFELTLKKKTA